MCDNELTRSTCSISCTDDENLPLGNIQYYKYKNLVDCEW